MLYHEFPNEIKIPMVGLGTYPLHGDTLSYTLKNALESGYELFDTAISYQNETEIGEYFKRKGSNNDNLFFTSKVSKKVLRGQKRFLFLDRKSVKSVYKQSCENLGMNKLGAYLIHYPFDGCSKYYSKLMELFDLDMVHVIGVSNFDIRELKELYAKCGRWPMMNQTEISPYNTQQDLIAFCQDKGILVQAYSPFGRGYLVKELMADNVLVEIANNHKRTVGQVILRSIVQQGVAVVARSSNQNRIKDNINIFDFELTKEEMSSIAKMNRNAVFGKNQVGKYDKKPTKI